MKTLPRIALTLAPLILNRGGTRPNSLKNNILLWCSGTFSFLFLLISLIITLSIHVSTAFAFFAIGLSLALICAVIWVKNKRDVSKKNHSVPLPGTHDAALLDNIPEEIRNNETFKSFTGLIKGHPYESILLSLCLGLIAGQQIKDND